MVFFVEKLSKTRKLNIVLSRHEGGNFILFELKRRQKDTVLWKTAGKIKMPLYKLKEIIKMLKEVKVL
jgi:hypothetical protein